MSGTCLHSQFAIELQIAESRIFIDEICRGLVGKDIIPITLHDGLLVKNKDADETYDYMKLVLSSHLGSAPSISVKKFSKPSRELNKETPPKLIDEGLNIEFMFFSYF